MTEIEKRLHDYWERRGVDYYVPDVFGRKIIAAHLVKLHPKSLIEAGCGNGELFSAYKDIPRVVGIDFSYSMLERARERIARHGYDNIVLRQADITKQEEIMPFTTHGELKARQDGSLEMAKPFDVALTRTVLMHIPETAKDGRNPLFLACQNLTLLSDNLVLMEYFRPDEDEKLDWHNFHHDYLNIFRNLNYELAASYDRPDGLHQILFHFQAKKLRITRTEDPEKQTIKIEVQ